MSERIIVDDAAPAARKAKPRKRRGSLLGRIVRWLVLLTVVLPVGLLLLFRFIPIPMTPLMISTSIFDGPVDHHWVPLSAISPNLVRAVIASEDGKFCSHYGFDLQAIDKAIERNAKGDGFRGASSITQQTAKNLFLLPDRTWVRKGIEAYFTVLIETLWPKQRIMETYLNIAEWGPHRFGAEAAARANFRKAASQLSPVEAARLATILPSPSNYRADVPGPFVARQSAVILARMGEVRRDRLDACIYQ